MAWSMHSGQRYDEARARWLAPPPVEEDRPVRVDAPTASALLVARQPVARQPEVAERSRRS